MIEYLAALPVSLLEMLAELDLAFQGVIFAAAIVLVIRLVGAPGATWHYRSVQRRA